MALTDFDSKTDAIIRGAALRWLAQKKQTNPDGVILFAEARFFVPELGTEINALSAQNGIWKPRQMQACLSVLSSHNHNHNYNDSFHTNSFSEDNVFFQYKYRTHGGYDHSDNRSLRLAMQYRLPVLYFLGIGRGTYLVEVVRVLQETPDKTGVLLPVLSAAPAALSLPDTASPMPEAAESSTPEMIYRTYAARTRLHQAEFRHRVMNAYRERCAVCRLKRVSLLDAAHIIPDAEGGRPEVPNGLSLCRIHHGAYDQNILGIDPDYRIHINRDMLEERDGPMLLHGFQEMNQQQIILPNAVRNRPDKDKLDQRYAEFRNSSSSS